jgi:hypothetical protein
MIYVNRTYLRLIFLNTATTKNSGCNKICCKPVSSQIMNTVVAASSNVGACTHIILCSVCTYYESRSAEKRLCQGHTINALISKHTLTPHKIARIYIHFWKCVFVFPSMAVQQRQYVNAVGCGALLAGWSVCLSVFDILQIPSGCIQCTRLQTQTPTLPQNPAPGIDCSIHPIQAREIW